MAYRFTSPNDYVEFAIAPLSGYSVGAITMAAYFKLASTSAQQLVGVCSSTFASKAGLRFNGANPRLFIDNGADGPQTFNTTAWHLLVATRPASSNAARFHVHNGTSWSHADYTSGATLYPVAFGGTDRLRVGVQGTSFPLNADMVCAGIKKTDSTDAQVETLLPNDFQSWRDFGFDWLVGFDASFEVSGLLQDQASPGTGDEVSRSFAGTVPISNPPGWGWIPEPTVTGSGKFSKIRFGPGFTVTDEGGGVIRVDIA